MDEVVEETEFTGDLVGVQFVNKTMESSEMLDGDVEEGKQIG
ncbi:hypothetical protein [Bacillus cereus]